MICNKKLQALFDAALRATEDPNLMHNINASKHQETPETGAGDPMQNEVSFEEQNQPQKESISFAPAFWKTAL
jgi:hypothetical protein